jgi:predicted AAA+ superfamily ATPase
MRDDELRRLLANANPWWTSAITGTNPEAWMSSNRQLRERTKYDFGYRSTVLDDVASLEPDGRLIVLTGPRRIRKSVTVIDAIGTLCADPRVDNRQIIHVPCDGMTDRDLRRSLTLGRAITSSVDQPEGRRRIWFFDEISSVPKWTSALKLARDGTDFGDDTVVATGSRWTSGEDVQGNLMAGRSGESSSHRIRQLLPMTFRHFLTATRPALPQLPVVSPADLQNASVRADLREIAFIVDDYDLAWQEFLTCGGFPRAVFEHSRLGAVTVTYARDLMAWLRADVDPDAPVDSVPLLLEALSARMTSPLNLTSTAQALGYPNRLVFDRRMTRLINSHAAVRCPQRRDLGSIVEGAQAKVYLTDPILTRISSIVSPGMRSPDMTQLSEAAIAVALARSIDGLDEGRWVSEDTIGYARTNSGQEVDLAPVRVPSSSGSQMTVPIESKWVDEGFRSGAKTIENKYNRGILATKSVLDLEHPTWAVPAPLLALLLQ